MITLNKSHTTPKYYTISIDLCFSVYRAIQSPVKQTVMDMVWSNTSDRDKIVNMRFITLRRADVMCIPLEHDHSN